MENKEDILKKLNSNDSALSEEAIQEIKTKGDLTIIPFLLDIVESGNNHEARNKIINLLSDIKENAFKDILMQRIKATTNSGNKALLLRICWESALDFSNEIPFFTEIMLKDDLEAALEAFTIIEETMHNLSDEERNDLMRELQSRPNSGNKQFLIDDLLSMSRP